MRANKRGLQGRASSCVFTKQTLSKHSFLCQTTSRSSRMANPASPPGPAVQKINAILHQEPLSTLFHGFYWSFFFLVWTPIIVVVLQVAAIVHTILWWLGLTNENTYDPSRQKEDVEFAVVITGCDSGFGKETAIWAGDMGYTVFSCCLNPESQQEFRSIPTIIPLQMDVTKFRDVQKTVRAVKEWMNDSNKTKKRVLHALVNNAGIAVGGDIDWCDMWSFEKSMDVNYLGTVRCCKAFLPILKQQSVDGTHKGSRILNVVSMAGLAAGGVGMGCYGPSKHAAQAFSACLRAELSVFGIQVTTINPSFHGTPMVAGIEDNVMKSWNETKESVREEYGEDYFAFRQEMAQKISHRSMWKQDVVVDQMVKSLKKKRLPDKVVIGTDARFLLILLRMAPGWVADLLSTLEGKPIPASIHKTEA